MREFKAVYAFTFRDNIRKKTFIVSTVIMLVLTMALMIVPGLISKNSAKAAPTPSKSTTSQTLYIVDKTGKMMQNTFIPPEVIGNCKVVFKDASEEKALIAAARKDANTFLIVLPGDNAKQFEYYLQKKGTGPDPSVIGPTLNTMYSVGVLQKAGVNNAVISQAVATRGINVQELGKGYVKSMMSGMLIVLVLFFAIYYFGFGVAMSVSSEKASRVMETLVTSTRPVNIIMGKTLAMGTIGLGQLALILGVGVAAHQIFFPGSIVIAGDKIDFSSFTPLAICMILVYFVLGYLLYALMNAVAGASVSKTEDVQAALAPITLISIFSFYLSYFPVFIPNSGKISSVTSLVPFTSPFAMPTKLIQGTVGTGELIASLAILIATIVVLGWLSVRIYSAAILHYGNRLKIKDIISLARSK